MPTFVASFANRFYAAKEANYGIGAAVDSGSRITAQELSFEQVTERMKRLDKTGSRTCVGTSTCGPRHSAFVMKTGLGKWTRSGAPAYGPFFESAMGAS